MSAYLDGELNTGLDDFEGHVQECEICRSKLEAMRLVWERLGSLQVPEPIPHFYTRLRARIGYGRRKGIRRRIERLMVPVTIMAAVALGIIMGSIVGQNGAIEPTASSVEEELIESYQLNSFEDFPSSSLGEAYLALAFQE